MKKLDKYVSVVALTVKNNKLKEEQDFVFSDKNKHAEFLKCYKHIIIGCSLYTCIDPEMLSLNDLNAILEKTAIELLGEDKFYKDVYRDLFHSLTYTSHFDEYTTEQRLFISIVHLIRHTPVLDKEKNKIFDFDYTFMLNDKKEVA